jgi:hypothetical protein
MPGKRAAACALISSSTKTTARSPGMSTSTKRGTFGTCTTASNGYASSALLSGNRCTAMLSVRGS